MRVVGPHQAQLTSAGCRFLRGRAAPPTARRRARRCATGQCTACALAPGSPGSRVSARIGAARASMRWRGVGRIAIRRSGGARSCFRVKPSFMIAWQWTYTRTRSKLERVAMLVEIRAQRVRNRSMRYSYMLGVGGAFGGECSHLPCPVSTPLVSSTRLRTRQPSPGSSGSRDGDWAPWPRQCPAATRRASGSGRSPPSAGPLSTPPARAAHARSAISVPSSLARSLARSLGLTKELKSIVRAAHEPKTSKHEVICHVDIPRECPSSL